MYTKSHNIVSIHHTEIISITVACLCKFINKRYNLAKYYIIALLTFFLWLGTRDWWAVFELQLHLRHLLLNKHTWKNVEIHFFLLTSYGLNSSASFILHAWLATLNSQTQADQIWICCFLREEKSQVKTNPSSEYGGWIWGQSPYSWNNPVTEISPEAFCAMTHQTAPILQMANILQSINSLLTCSISEMIFISNLII